mgnify:CR=1 FL=1
MAGSRENRGKLRELIDKFQFVELRKSKFGEAEMDKYNELKEKFEANRNDENATKMAAYMRNLFAFYGLPTPKRKSIYKEFLRAEKQKRLLTGICLTGVMQTNIGNSIIL